MSRLSRLIDELCPEGVEVVRLVNVANVLYGYPFQAELFTDDSSYIPLIRIRDVVPAKAGTYYKGEIEENYIIKRGDILVGMDGNFNLAKWNDRDGLLNQRVCKIYSKDENVVLDGYLFHYLKPLFKSIENSISGSTVKHLSAKKINTIEIPLPPLSIQEEIVKILDKFTTLEAELEAELDCRKRQYQYYRDLLLNFKDNEGTKVEFVKMGDYFVFKNGINKGKQFFGSGDPIVNFTDVYNNRYLTAETLKGKVQTEPKDLIAYDAKKGDIFFTRTSETREDIGKASALIEDVDRCVFSGFVLRARPKTKLWSPKFCAYYFSSSQVRSEITRYASFTTRALTSGPRLSKIRLPLISLAEQEKIVSILDRFERLTTDLQSGLPAEIEARRQQYEYYRDKLLSFPKNKVSA